VGSTSARRGSLGSREKARRGRAAGL